jgi:hypothetical protein
MNFDDRKARIFNRTMHTPDDDARAAQRSKLRELSKQLMPLHRALIEAAKADYALAYQPIENPTQFLRLLNDDPFFEWLKPLTSLIVDIDDMARRDFTANDFEAISQRFEALFGANSSSDFTKKYLPMLQQSIDLAVAHAALRKLDLSSR